MKKFKAIIFDMDGVIVNSEELWEKSGIDFYKKHVPNITPEVCAKFPGLNMRGVYQLVKKEFKINVIEEDFVNDFSNFGVDNIYYNVELVPGVKELIIELSKEYDLAIASAAPWAWINVVFERFKLEKYFKCDVFLSDIQLWRNYNHNDTLNLNVSHFGNHFHQDSYTMTYSKIFVNLMDVNDDDGPLEVIPREKRNSFVKSFNYKDMDNYNLFGDKTLIKKNIGKIGECCLFSSSQIFHRAGVPKNYRDNMQIILVTIPKKFSEKLQYIDNDKLFENNYELFQKFTKPYSIVKVVKLFFTLFRYKFNA